jgi:hypothetical protein
MEGWFLQLSRVNTGAEKGIQTIILLTLWFIWKEQNNRIFQSTQRTVRRLLADLQDEARVWCLAGATDLSLPVAPPDRE